MFKEIKECRICKNPQLVSILHLGDQYLTGVFPKNKADKVTHGPVELVKCMDTKGHNACGLVQLRQSYDLSELYGMNYGYRSGLNKSMVEHLHSKVRKIREIVKLSPGDLVIDIGSNDGTTLAAYPPEGLQLVGIDPTGTKFKSYYLPHIKLIPDFFSHECVNKNLGHKKAKIITSFSMFYDLENPLSFMQQVHEVLDQEGIWVFEQSYMPTMIKTNSFDTVCQEHLEYYALKQIKWMADKVGFKIIDIEFNDINGGSFSLTVAKAGSNYKQASNLEEILAQEIQLGFDSLQPFLEFAKRIEKSKEDLLHFIQEVQAKGQKIFGLGASTKGNVILQYCGITSKDLPFIGEVNTDKWGTYTPGTLIPIIAEEELLDMKPDYLLVLPWHFRSFFVKIPKFKKYKLVFPLPHLEIV